MAKNIKEIVDEGFSRLANLAEKRLEILSRCQQISNAATGPQIEAAELKVKAAESNYIAEINTQVDHLLTELRQTLAQVAENNLFFQAGSRDKLTMHVGEFLALLHNSQDYMLKGSSDRMSSLFLQTEKEFKSHEDTLGSESLKLLSELDALCGRSQSALIQTHAEISGKLAHNHNELSGLLDEACNTIIQNAEKKRQKTKEQLDKLARGQTDELSKAALEMDTLVAGIVTESLENMRTACLRLEKDLDQKRDLILNNALSELRTASKDSLLQLEDSYEYSRNELSEKLAGLRELTKKLLQQEQQSLAELDNVVKDSAEGICTELRNSGANGTAAALRHNPVEEAFSEIAEDLNELSEELSRKTKDLLKAQAEGMEKISAAAEKSILDLFADVMVQMKDTMKVQDQLCNQKEEELLRQLAKLEKQITETRAELNGGNSGASGGAK